jgi:RNA recognition motif-containing protein
MGSKLFIGGLAWATDDQSLRTACEAFGTVTQAKVITDRETGRSRGFGFVTLSSSEEARAAIAGLDGTELDGRAVRVNEAQERSGGGGRRDSRGGGGGGGGGGGDRW